MTALGKSIWPIAAAVVLLLAGCTVTDGDKTPTPISTDQQEEKLNSKLTWEDAKATTQETELEIAGVVPENVVVKIDQQAKGMLLSCDAGQHSWLGATSVTVTPGTDIESLVKDIETRYADGRFTISTRLDVAGAYEAHLKSRKDDGESYVIGQDIEPDQLRIDSGSSCFTLPEGVYPGGDF